MCLNTREKASMLKVRETSLISGRDDSGRWMRIWWSSSGGSESNVSVGGDISMLDRRVRLVIEREEELVCINATKK